MVTGAPLICIPEMLPFLDSISVLSLAGPIFKRGSFIFILSL